MNQKSVTKFHYIRIIQLTSRLLNKNEKIKVAIELKEFLLQMQTMAATSANLSLY